MRFNMFIVEAKRTTFTMERDCEQKSESSRASWRRSWTFLNADPDSMEPAGTRASMARTNGTVFVRLQALGSQERNPSGCEVRT
jgi:hypothetical protein